MLELGEITTGICILAKKAHFVVTGLIWALFLLENGFAQVDSPQDNTTPSSSLQQSQDIPKNALWRFGKFGLRSDNNGYYALAFSPNSKYLATRNRNNFVSVYDTTTRKKLFELEGEDGLIKCLHFSPNSKSLLTGASGPGEKIKVWDIQSGKLITEFGDDPLQAFFTQDGKAISVLGPESLEFYASDNGSIMDRVKWKSNHNERRHTHSLDGQLVILSSNSLNQLQVLNTETRAKTFLDGPNQQIKQVTLSHNKLWVAASYNRDPKIRIWDLRDPSESKYILNKHTQTVQSLSFSPDGRFLLSTSWDDTAIVWDLLTREPVANLEGHKSNVNSSAFANSGLLLATGASGVKDSSAILWELKPFLFDQEIPKAMDSFEVVWKELGSNFPTQAFTAVNALVQKPDRFLERLSQRLGVDLDKVSNEKIQQLIVQLDSPKYREREFATEELMKIRGHADPQLQQALLTAPSTEVRYRINLILRPPVRRPKINFDELRRLHRSVFALELIGNEQALDLLNSIGSGHANIDVALDAKSSAKRVRENLEESTTSNPQ